jgi:threonylcarbamoyladenosine tRNA methylthiotransferase MtaB
MKTVAFHTLGCKVNQAETETVEGLFVKEGYKVVDFKEKADVYVINTCTVTHLGDRKSRQLIKQAHRRNPQAVIVAMGCYAQIDPDSVVEIEGVNLVIGTQNRSQIVKMVERVRNERQKVKLVGDIMEAQEFEEIPVYEQQGRTRVSLKIQEGCQQFCSYCIIPYTRGPLRSRKMENIIEQVKKIEKAGFKEIVLTGIHLGMYGIDLGKEASLADVAETVANFQGIERVRIGSIDPMDISPQLIQTIKKEPKICNHLHIPLQSGDDWILSRMNRPYNRSEFAAVINTLRSEIPDIAISTDIIAGFPGEEEQHFQHTLEFCRNMNFMRMHIFKYSPRKGTVAAEMEKQILPQVKEERSKKLSALAGELALEYHKSLVGKILPVLFEQNVDMYRAQGLNEYYVKTIVPCRENLEGQIKSVKITAADMECVAGEIIDL